MLLVNIMALYYPKAYLLSSVCEHSFSSLLPFFVIVVIHILLTALVLCHILLSDIDLPKNDRYQC